ncbi:MAG: peptidoglycan DD-metalloendopeptidase family protein, partial [Chloroflexota bacterium]
MDILDHTPNFSAEAALEILQSNYGITGELKPLPSERDQNFRVTANGHEGLKHYVLKIANGLENPNFLDAQHQVWGQLVGKIDFCPQLVPTVGEKPSFSVNKAGKAVDGRTSKTVDKVGKTVDNHNGSVESSGFVVQLVTWLDGVPLADVGRQTDGLMRDLGRKLGQMDAALISFDHPAAHRKFHWDLAHGLEIVAEKRHLINEPHVGELVDNIVAGFKSRVVPILPKLRQSVIHNDANDHNVVCGNNTNDLYSKNQTITGIIDFGDMVYSYTVGNLAIAVAYAILDKKDPWATAAKIVVGYHEAMPLTEDEIETIWGFVALRMATSVVIAAEQMAARPDDPYLAISQGPIRRTLPRLYEAGYTYSTAVLRAACGLAPIPTAPSVVEFLNKQESFGLIVGEPMTAENTIGLDLSPTSSILHGDFAENSEPKFSARLFGLMANAGATFSIGRWSEPRLIYTADFFKTGEGPLDERRAVHVAIDIFAEAKWPIHAPLDGTVHWVCYRPDDEDYGHLLILEHQTDDGVPFWTLYGHLGEETLELCKMGQTVKAGDQVGTLGRPDENGNWPPHLHFQLITDLLHFGDEFPGVGLNSQLAVWQSLSPDPSIMLGVPAGVVAPISRPKEETLTVRREKIGRNLSIGYKNHLKIVRGWKQYLWDDRAQKYLDAYNNVP